mgnify:CR=1 FL=1
MGVVTDWSKYAPHFTRSEFVCKHTGKCEMQAETMGRLHLQRRIYGRPMDIQRGSGYRDATHPVEVRKAEPGAHARGRAADTPVAGGAARRFLFATALVSAVEAGLLAEEQARAWLPEMLKHGFTGIGVHQKGGGRFIHLDDATRADGLPRPAVWSY